MGQCLVKLLALKAHTSLLILEKTIYTQKNSVTHAEDRLFDSETIEAIAENGIWLNNSPCPRCARKIMNQYHDYPNTEDKPTIYI